MKNSMEQPTSAARRALRTLVILVVLVALAGRTGSAVGAARHHEAPLDLAAMALTIPDLEEIGLEGYGHDGGDLLGPEAQAEEFATNWSYPEDEARDVFAETDLEWGYWLRYALPLDPDQRRSLATRFVQSRVLQFADADGAEDALPFLAGEDAVNVEPVEDAPTVGDESAMTQTDWIDAANDEAGTSLDLTFQTGRFVGMISVWDVARDGEDEEPVVPEVDEVQALGERLLERIEDGVDGAGPGLSYRVLRLDVANVTENVEADFYDGIDGTALRCYCESEEDHAARAAGMDRRGLLDTYHFEQWLPNGRDAHDGDPYLVARLIHFEDDDAAETWLDEVALGVAGSSPSVTDFEPLDDPDDLERIEDLGDGAVGAYVEMDWHGAREGYVVIVRVDDVIALVKADSSAGVELDVVVDLAETQIDCLQAEGGCPEPAPVPNDLRAG